MKKKWNRLLYCMKLNKRGSIYEHNRIRKRESTDNYAFAWRRFILVELQSSIFLECRNRRDFSDFNTLIYGHNIRGGLMFGPLKRYAEQAYLDAHRLVYIVTEDAVRRYEVFAAYEAGVTSDTYRLYFKDDERKQAALDDYVAAAAVGTGVTPSPDDRILTLSTCTGTGTYDTRWVVQAVLTGEFSR